MKQNGAGPAGALRSPTVIGSENGRGNMLSDVNYARLRNIAASRTRSKAYMLGAAAEQPAAEVSVAAAQSA